MRRIAVLLLGVVATGIAILPGSGGPTSPPSAQGQEMGSVTLEWLGWNAWRGTSPTGKVILLNPFVANPDSPVSVDDITRVDLILVTDIHADEVGQTIQIAERTGARVVSPTWDAGGWLLESGLPLAQLSRNGHGDRVRLEGITIRLTNAVHGSANPAVTPGFSHGGPAAAYVITFENGWTLYYGGSTAATYDQTMVGQLYRPDAAILYMGRDKEPLDFAMQVRFLMTDNPNLTAIFPGHHGVVQQGTTIAEAQEAVWGMGMTQTVIEPLPGQVFTYTK